MLSATAYLAFGSTTTQIRYDSILFKFSLLVLKKLRNFADLVQNIKVELNSKLMLFIKGSIFSVLVNTYLWSQSLMNKIEYSDSDI